MRMRERFWNHLSGRGIEVTGRVVHQLSLPLLPADRQTHTTLPETEEVR